MKFFTTFLFLHIFINMNHKRYNTPQLINAATQEFIIGATKKHGNKYDYSKVIYGGKKVEIICSKHGSFYKRPFEHLRGQGCPKCKISMGELEIMTYMDEKNISYVYQKLFFDCRSPKGYPLKFDFFVPKNKIIIEYDGKQHFYSGQFMRGQYLTTEADLDYSRIKDKIKDDYCHTNNFKLIRIPYIKLGTIQQILKEELYG